MALRGLMVSRFEVNNNNDRPNQNRVLFSCLREITVTLFQPPPNAAGRSGTSVSEYGLVSECDLKFIETKRGDRYRHTHSRMRTSSFVHRLALHTG